MRGVGRFGLGLAAVTALACGKPSQEAVDIRNGMRPVQGTASIGTQCDYGTFQEPLPFKMGLWDCPLEDPALAAPPPALLLKGDCKKREIAIRAANREFEPTSWLVYPDQTFYATLDHVTVELADDGTGRGRCISYAKLRISDGTMQCRDRSDPERDRITIQGDVLWYLNQGVPSPEDTRLLEGARQCELPAGCYLHTRLRLQQCS